MLGGAGLSTVTEMLILLCVALVFSGGIAAASNGTLCTVSVCMKNGGSCAAGTTVGAACVCECACGTSCSPDISACCLNGTDPCNASYCENGGSCVNNGTDLFYCLCDSFFTGEQCDVAVCTPDYCYNGGTCSVSGSKRMCDCPSGFGSTRCEIDMNFCMAGYCKNGGTCVEGYGTAISCNCTSEYTGDTCQDAFCTPDYCFNNGTCTVSGPNHMCACPLGYNGTRCENDQDGFCDDDSCKNGGTCVEGKGSMTWCNCTERFIGDRCEYCNPDYCHNNGTCSTGAGVPCMCTAGFTGTQCEIDEDYCTATTCKNGGTCIEGYGDATTCLCAVGYSGLLCGSVDCMDYCMNNGSCLVVPPNPAVCTCSVDYSGKQCDVPLDACSEGNETLCQNGGTCVDGVGYGFNYTCQCPLHFYGLNCEENACIPNPCQNSGTCQNVLGSGSVGDNSSVYNFECDCPVEHSGDRCEYVNACKTMQDLCLNGGTCVDDEFGDGYTCICPSGITGANCSSTPLPQPPPPPPPPLSILDFVSTSQQTLTLSDSHSAITTTTTQTLSPTTSSLSQSPSPSPQASSSSKKATAPHTSIETSTFSTQPTPTSLTSMETSTFTSQPTPSPTVVDPSSIRIGALAAIGGAAALLLTVVTATCLVVARISDKPRRQRNSRSRGEGADHLYDAIDDVYAKENRNFRAKSPPQQKEIPLEKQLGPPVHSQMPEIPLVPLNDAEGSILQEPSAPVCEAEWDGIGLQRQSDTDYKHYSDASDCWHVNDSKTSLEDFSTFINPWRDRNRRGQGMGFSSPFVVLSRDAIDAGSANAELDRTVGDVSYTHIIN